MEQQLIAFLKKPIVSRSLYFISCMVIAFGLGVITEYSIINRNNQPTIELPAKPAPLAFRYKTVAPENVYDVVPAEPIPENQTPTMIIQPEVSSDTEKRFVASKTGTKYYPPDCGGISRIKAENRVYFATEQEAQDKGYTRTTTCN